tara:strand:- start:273 stop:509 length:237 start_codon:yes stop_codon:yes gene_type:complete
MTNTPHIARATIIEPICSDCDDKDQTIVTLTAELREVDDTLRVLAISLTETDAALFAQEIAVIKNQRETLAAALKGKS